MLRERGLQNSGSEDEAASFEVKEDVLEQRGGTEAGPEESRVSLERGIKDKGRAIDQTSASIDNTQNQLKELRGEMGLPSSEGDSPSVQAEQQRVARLQSETETLISELDADVGQAGEGSTDAGKTGERYVHPTPSITEKGAQGSGFEQFTYYKFSPQERQTIEQNKDTFDGERYRPGEEVIVNGSLYRVQSVEQATIGEDDTQMYDQKKILETVTPSALELISIDMPGETWTVREGDAVVERATAEAKTRVKEIRKSVIAAEGVVKQGPEAVDELISGAG